MVVSSQWAAETVKENSGEKKITGIEGRILNTKETENQGD